MSGIAIVCMIVFFIFGIAILAKDVKMKTAYKKKTKGIIVDIYKKEKLDREEGVKTFLYPIFEYSVLGNTYTKKSDIGHGEKSFKYNVGQEVGICYNDKNPEEFYVQGDNSRLIAGTILTGIGLLCLIVAICNISNGWYVL